MTEEISLPSRPAVDVVILASSREHELNLLLGSIAVQRYDGPVHVILVTHGAATEFAPGVAATTLKGTDVRYTVLPVVRNIGVPGGRHVGISLGTGDIIVCLDDDAAFASDDAIEVIASVFACEPMVGAIAFRIEDRDTGEIDAGCWAFGTTVNQATATRHSVHTFVGAGHAIRRVAYCSAGGYDPSLFFYWEELDLAIRLLMGRWKVEYIPRVRVLHWTAPQGRVVWGNGRYHYYARNGVLVRARYFGMFIALLFGMGYLLRGTLWGVPGQALVGVTAGIAASVAPDHPRNQAPRVIRRLLRQDLGAPYGAARSNLLKVWSQSGSSKLGRAHRW